MELRSEVANMDAARKLQQYTIDDIYALPDGERAELIDGKIWLHQVKRIKESVENFIRR